MAHIGVKYMPFSRLNLFLLFLLVNTIASKVNHIDDTDETYGYYEPLHYLLYGNCHRYVMIFVYLLHASLSSY